jgi:hypothetical protein
VPAAPLWPVRACIGSVDAWMQLKNMTYEMRALFVGLGNLDAFFGRFSRLFLDYFQVKFRLFLDGLMKI